jgi:prepilin-type N-terminal cleavage/methylation domain-containing protein
MLTSIPMEMSGQSRSRFRSVHRRQSPGFTLIELVIVVVIVAIGVALAVPSFRTIVEKRHLTSATEQIAAFMTIAQSEAVKHNREVIVNMQRTNSSTWCIGATLGAAACDCSELDTTVPNFCDIADVPQRIDQAYVISRDDYQFMHIMKVNGTTTANASFSFDPVRGTLLDLETILIETHTHTMEGVDEGTRDYSLVVQVSPTGRVEICNALVREFVLRQYPDGLPGGVCS